MKNYVEIEDIKIYYTFAWQKDYIEDTLGYLGLLETAREIDILNLELQCFFKALDCITEYCKIPVPTVLRLITIAHKYYAVRKRIICENVIKDI